MSIEITDEMVKTAALGAFNETRARHGFPPLEEIEGGLFAAESWRAALSAVAPLIATAEREACALVVRQLKVQYASSFDHGFNTALGCAASAIRARSS